MWVSNGFMSPETLDVITPYLDASNIDIKSFADDFYQKNCGARLAPVLKNCQRLVRDKVWLEVTTLIIPTLSDNPDMLRQLAEFIRDQLGDYVPWHVSAFSGAISWRLKHLPDTPVATVRQAYEIGKEVGLHNVYVGNVWEEDVESTYCPKCRAVVIKRQGYQVKRFDKNGACPKCGEKIAGVWQ